MFPFLQLVKPQQCLSLLSPSHADISEGKASLVSRSDEYKRPAKRGILKKEKQSVKIPV